MELKDRRASPVSRVLKGSKVYRVSKEKSVRKVHKG
jgi:hypothetical protein